MLRWQQVIPLICVLIVLINQPLAHGQENDEDIDEEDADEEPDDENEESDEESDDQDDYLITTRELESLHKFVDEDGDGKLTLKEAMAYSAKIGASISSEQARLEFKDMDADKSGHVSLEEYTKERLKSYPKGFKHLEHNLEIDKRKFAAVDTDGDKHLNIDELALLHHPSDHPGIYEGLLELNMELNQKPLDTDGDGKWTPDEFWNTATYGNLTDSEVAHFLRLDKDGDGKLNMSEVKPWESGWYHMRRAMKGLIDAADKNGDKSISVQELVNAKQAIIMSNDPDDKENPLSDAQHILIQWSEHHEL